MAGGRSPGHFTVPCVHTRCVGGSRGVVQSLSSGVRVPDSQGALLKAIAFGCGGDWRCPAGGIVGRVRAAARPECLTKLKDVRQGITKKDSCCPCG
jgi:hypothetical protein